jgi:hypothetical protein
MAKQIIIQLRIFGILLALIGIVFLSLWIYSIRYYYHLGLEHIQAFETNFSLLITVLNYHYNTLLFLSTMLGGILIFKLKKSGYLLCITSTTLLFFTSIRAFIISFTPGISSSYNQMWMLLFPLFFLTLLVFLLSRTKRNYFQLSTKNIGFILLMAIISIADSLLTTSYTMTN